MTRRRLITLIALIAAFVGMPSIARAQNPDWPLSRPPKPLPAHSVPFPPCTSCARSTMACRCS